MAAFAVVVLVAIEAVSTSTILFCCRSFLGYAFSNIKEVVDYFERLVPLLSLSFIMDSLLAVLSGMLISYLASYIFNDE